jgi:hypothetical protein
MHAISFVRAPDNGRIHPSGNRRLHAHRAPMPEPVDDPLPDEHPAPQEDPVPSPKPETH